MSEDARQRATARESRIWRPFQYPFPFSEGQAEERAIIYGLYSRAYLNGQKYLEEVETQDLLNLLTDYTSKMAELTTQEQVLVATIASKRYLAGIDMLIHDERMAVLSDKISAENAVWDAKIAALSADQAALDTMAAKVAAETEKTNARIATLQAYIQVEEYELSAVDLQIAEKEIQSAKVDIDILNASNAVLKIQAETVSKATELVEIDMRKATIQLNTKQQELKIADIDLLPDEVEIQKGKTAIAEAEIPVAEARRDLAQAQSADMDAEILYQETLKQRETISQTAKMEVIDHNYGVKSETLERAKEKDEFDIDKKYDESNLGVTFADADRAVQSVLDEYRINVISGRRSDAYTKIDAAIAAAEKMAKADIVSTLTHTIGKAGLND